MISPPKRGRWRSKDHQWNASTVKGILDNPAYHGARVYNRYSSSKIVAVTKGRTVKPERYQSWMNSQDDWTTTENAHPAIISKEEWEKAQEITRRQEKKKRNRHSYVSAYLLSGLMHCAHCGYPYQGLSSTVRGKPYLRYIDGGWKAKRSCTWTAIKKELIEAFVLDAVERTLAETMVLDQLIDKVASLLATSTENGREQLESDRKSRAVIEEKIANLLHLAEEGHASGKLKERLTDLEVELAALSNRIERAEAAAAPMNKESAARAVVQFGQNFRAKFEAARPELQKIALTRCISEIVVDPDEGYADVFIRRIPAVTPEIEEAFNLIQLKASVASTACARNRT